MANELWINGRDVGDFNLHVSRFDKALGSLDVSRPGQQANGRVGQIAGTRDFRLMPKELVATGWINSATPGGLVSDLDNLHPWLSFPWLEIRTIHDPTRVLYGQLKTSTMPPADPQGAQTYADGDLVFILNNPLYYERQVWPWATSSTGQAGRIPIPCGGGPTQVLLQILGPATNPTVTLRTPSGVVLKSVTYAITLGANDYLAIDCNLWSIFKSVAGTVSAADDTVATGIPFFTLLPWHADRASGSYSTLETSAGTLLAKTTRTWML